MSTKKIYDLAVKVGEYQKDGETKGRYENVGAILQKEDGGKFIFFKRTFNPAGVPNPDDRDNVIVSMFAVDREKQQAASTPAPAQTQDIDDDIPF